MQYIRLNDCDRRAIAAYLAGCQAGWQESACFFVARQIQADDARLRRVIYLARTSDPIAFSPNPEHDPGGLRCIHNHDGEQNGPPPTPAVRTERVSTADLAPGYTPDYAAESHCQTMKKI